MDTVDFLRLNNSSLVFICVMFAIIFLCIGSCSYFNNHFGFEDDNEFEEQVENMIKHYTGAEVDLSGQSLEQN